MPVLCWRAGGAGRCAPSMPGAHTALLAGVCEQVQRIPCYGTARCYVVLLTACLPQSQPTLWWTNQFEGTSGGMPAERHVRCTTLLLSRLPARKRLLRPPVRFLLERNLCPHYAFAHQTCQPSFLCASCADTAQQALSCWSYSIPAIVCHRRTCFELLLQLLGLLLLDASFENNWRLFDLCHRCTYPLTPCDICRGAVCELNGGASFVFCLMRRHVCCKQMPHRKGRGMTNRVWVWRHAPAPWPPSGLSSSSCGPP